MLSDTLFKSKPSPVTRVFPPVWVKIPVLLFTFETFNVPSVTFILPSHLSILSIDIFPPVTLILELALSVTFAPLCIEPFDTVTVDSPFSPITRFPPEMLSSLLFNSKFPSIEVFPPV